MKAEQQPASSISELMNRLNSAIEMREEGLIVKRPDSTYRLNTRTNDAGWLKIKVSREFGVIFFYPKIIYIKSIIKIV